MVGEGNGDHDGGGDGGTSGPLVENSKREEVDAAVVASSGRALTRPLARRRPSEAPSKPGWLAMWGAGMGNRKERAKRN